MTDKDLTNYAALILRVSMGIMFLLHGAVLKLMTFTPAGTAQYFQSIGYPGFVGYLVIAGEIVGGLMLIAGFKVRLVSLAFVPLLLGAAQQHVTNGWLFSAPGGGFEFPVFWAVVLVAQALLGSGAYGLDNADERGNRSHRPAAA